MARPVVFVVVGAIGYAVQTAALWLLVAHAHLPVVAATLAATELAVLHNFTWHQRWTWADRPSGTAEALGRLLRFNVANGGVSLAGGTMLMALLVHGLGLHYLAANAVTVGACSAVNYIAGDRWVFAIRGVRRRGHPAPAGTRDRPERVAGTG